MKEESYYIDRSMSIRKSVIIYHNKGSVHSPIVYIKKPKWVSEEEFNDFLDRMQIMVKPKKY
jgi:hypothetical protein